MAPPDAHSSKGSDSRSYPRAEIARAILLGLPLDQAGGSAGAKKARTARP